MKKYYTPPILAFFGTALIIYLICDYFSIVQKKDFVDIYNNKFQVPLFTGFLTISGFLLSLTTFIVVKMHEAVYQDKFYYERVETFKRIDPEYSQTKPLENLSSFLLVSVVTALLTSFSQLTLGNVKDFLVVTLCLSLVASASIFVLTSCVLIKKNINVWIKFMKEKKENEQSSIQS